MAKSKLSEAANAAKTIAGAALGAAAIAATGVVVNRVAHAIKEGGKQLEEAAPAIQQMAAETVTKPLLPKRAKPGGGRKKAKAAKKAARTRASRRLAGARTAGKRTATKRKSRR